VSASLSQVARLDSAALEHGDVVAVALPPGPDWLDLVREIWDAGAALLPVDHRLPEPETRALLRRARPTVTLSPGGWERRADGAAAEADLALVVSTSGTGGEPKLVQFDRAAIDAAVAAAALALAATPHDRWLCCLPLAHVGTQVQMHQGLILGAPVTVHPGFATADVAAGRDVALRRSCRRCSCGCSTPASTSLGSARSWSAAPTCPSTPASAPGRPAPPSSRPTA
jgi:long-subunit acyl-CoA synthetase (AMP-forming)